jgi:plasmid maintenance system antidote protein VapI
MLLEEFLKPLEMSQTELAERIRVPYVRDHAMKGSHISVPSLVE